jgi:Trp operon repressor
MTRFADSFAIATGGSTFYRNRIKALLAKGMDQKAAEAQAFFDFRQIAEESQQSSNPNRISQQQASGAGRVILAWANTPMQYARIQKRDIQDLINRRGDWKTKVSRIVYYGAVQNLIFNALQQAVFALGFGEDDEEEMDAKKSEKISRIANGMIDSQLKGLGIGGAAVVAVKSALMELGKQHAKDRPAYEEAVFDLLGFSPPLGSKIQKINSGLRSFSWNMKDIKDKGFSLDNPAYLAGAQITTGLTNIPLDRVIKKINSMRGLVNEQSSLWQKVALGLGWSTWDVGLGYYGGFDAAKVLTPEEEKVKEIDDMKKLTKTQEQIDMLLDLGLTKKEIKALGKEQARVEKIIELQNAEAKPKEEVKVKEEIKKETKPTPEVKAKPKTESVERRLRRQFDSIKDENKPDQVKTLLKFGLTKKEIRTLQYEKNRVNKILELMPKNK